ncbi:unnamed protein product, partial [Protopolystoma xenopodis]
MRLIVNYDPSSLGIIITAKFFGVALITLGVIVSIDHADFSEIVGSALYASGSYVLVFSGIITLMISVFGYIGVDRENRCFLITYLIILILVLLLIFISGIIILAFKDSLSDAAKNFMSTSIVSHYGRYQIITNVWDLVQKKLRCCAVENRGWGIYNSSWWNHFYNADIYDGKTRIPGTVNCLAHTIETNLFFLFVPLSCCWTLVDPRTGWPSDVFRDQNRCRNWQ